MRTTRLALLLTAVCLSAAPVFAQAPPAQNPPPPPPPPFTGNVSFGLGVTSGNSDTTTVNAGYEFKWAPAGPNVLKSGGLFLYGKTDGVVSTEQYGLNVRDEYNLNPRTFLFGEVRYLHDKFKGIEYLVAPTGGVGFKLVAQPKTELTVSAGAGGSWEKDYGVDVKSNGAMTFDEKLTVKLSPAVTVGESFYSLWNISDFGDALYVFRANLVAALAGNLQFKTEFADTYRTVIPATVKDKNDIALIVAVVYKF